MGSVRVTACGQVVEFGRHATLRRSCPQGRASSSLALATDRTTAGGQGPNWLSYGRCARFVTGTCNLTWVGQCSSGPHKPGRPVCDSRTRYLIEAEYEIGKRRGRESDVAGSIPASVTDTIPWSSGKDAWMTPRKSAVQLQSHHGMSTVRRRPPGTTHPFASPLRFRRDVDTAHVSARSALNCFSSLCPSTSGSGTARPSAVNNRTRRCPRSRFDDVRLACSICRLNRRISACTGPTISTSSTTSFRSCLASSFSSDLMSVAAVFGSAICRSTSARSCASDVGGKAPLDTTRHRLQHFAFDHPAPAAVTLVTFLPCSELAVHVTGASAVAAEYAGQHKRLVGRSRLAVGIVFQPPLHAVPGFPVHDCRPVVPDVDPVLGLVPDALGPFLLVVCPVAATLRQSCRPNCVVLALRLVVVPIVSNVGGAVEHVAYNVPIHMPPLGDGMPSAFSPGDALA